MSTTEKAVVTMSDEFVKRSEFNRLDERVNTMDKRITALSDRQTRTEVRTDHIEKQLEKISSNTTWILRLVIGAIITALLGLIII